MKNNLYSPMRVLMLLAGLASAGLAQAQEVGKHALDYSYAPGSPQYWRNTHSTRPGNTVTADGYNRLLERL